MVQQLSIQVLTLIIWMQIVQGFAVELSAVNTSSTSIRVRWSEKPEEAVMGYQITYRPLDPRVAPNENYTSLGCYTQLVCVDLNSTVLKHLRIYTNYLVQVNFFNSTCVLPEGVNVTARTDEGAPGSPPNNVTSTSVNSTSVWVSWSEVPLHHRHGLIQFYTLILTSDKRDDKQVIRNVTNGQRTTIVNGLNKFTRYSIRIQAFTSKGGSNISEVVGHVLTAEDAPDKPPRIITIVEKNSTSIILKIWPPVEEDLNGHLKGYRITYREAVADANVTLQDFAFDHDTPNNSVHRRSREIHLDDLKPFTNYSVQAAAITVKVGPYSEPMIVTSGESVPSSPPLNVTAFNTSSTSITVTWQKIPLDKIHGRLLGYNVTYREAGASSHPRNVHVKLVAACNETSFAKLTGLKKFVEYEIFVAGFTRKGSGNHSVVNCSTDEDVPTGPPLNVTIEYRKSAYRIGIAWSPVRTNETNGHIVKYAVYIFDKHGQVNYSSVIHPERRWVVQGLDVRSNYSVKIQAFTRIGPGPNSSLVNFTTRDVAPRFVPNVTAVPINSSTILVTWFGSDPNHILQYLVKYSATGNNSVLECVPAKTDQLRKPYELYLHNLHVYTEYKIQVAAMSTLQGNFSEPVPCRTNESVPTGPPLNVNVTERRPHEARVVWSPVRGNETNGHIMGYNVYVFNESGIVLQMKKLSNVTSFVIGDLTVLTNYSVSVQAFTSIGAGPNSSKVYFSTTNEAPTFVPLNLKAVAKNSTTIHVTWTCDSNLETQENIREYVVKYWNTLNDPTFKRVPVSAQKAELHNLLPYTEYNITVAAFNDLDGNYSKPVSNRTHEGVPVGFPLNVEVKSGETEATISWKKVRGNETNGRIRGYLVHIYDLEDSSWQRTENTSALKFVVKDLETFHNYSVKVQAYTNKGKGPNSTDYDFSTLDKAPQFTPGNVTANATSSTTILVKWDAVSDQQREKEKIREYVVRYQVGDLPFRTEKILVSEGPQIHLSNLHMYTKYKIQVAASNTAVGNFSGAVFSLTNEGVPSSPPVKVNLKALDSTSIRVGWDPVPLDHQNGVIRGFRVNYRVTKARRRRRRSTSEVWLGEKIVHPDNSLVIITSLDKATEYTVRITAFTSKGDGNFTETSAVTGESVPSAAPQNITAQNRTNIDRIHVSWLPVPTQHQNGKIIKYLVAYQAVSIGDKAVNSQREKQSEVTSPDTNFTIENLEPYVVYKIKVSAMTKIGPGPAAVTYGETCHCEKNLSTNWRQYPPYVDISLKRDQLHIIPQVLRDMTKHCCAHCAQHGQSVVDFEKNGHRQPAEQKSDRKLLDNIISATDFSFPVYGYKGQEKYKGGFGFAPLVESSGVAFIVVQNTSDVKDAMFDSVMKHIPLLMMPIVTAFVAGCFIWMLESKYNPDHFPKSFVEGVWEGAWWSFVTMTTVGYGDRSPLGYAGRLFGMAWFLVGLIIMAMTMAAMTSSLTTITMDSTPKLYGSKVAAIHESPEYNLGKRRNAIVNPTRNYHTLEEISEDLIKKAVPGALVDSYAAGVQSHLFSKPFLQVAEVLDYQTAYGIVLGGNATRLQRCFSVYAHENRGSIFQLIKSNVKSVEVPPEDLSEVSTGLFDPDSELFRKSLKFTIGLLVVLEVLGLLYSLWRRCRRRAKVHDLDAIDVQSINELKALVEEFYQRGRQTKEDIQKRHRQEIRKLLECKKYKQSQPSKLFICRVAASQELKPPKTDSQMELVSL